MKAEAVQPYLQLLDNVWIETRDGDPSALALFHRHYSYRQREKPPSLFAGPGQKMVLVTPDCDALFVWRKFISGDGQTGVNCAVFRNEGPIKSSVLIWEACRLAWQRWPGERLYTYVNPRKIRSTNPGCCFLKAGWRKCGITKKNKLLILECIPAMLGD